MFIRLKNMPSGKTAVQIVSSVRNNGKVQQKIIRHVGTANNENEVILMNNLAKQLLVEMKLEIQPSLFSHEEMVETVLNSKCKNKVKTKLDADLGDVKEEIRIITGIHEIYGEIYRNIGFDRVLSNPSRKIASTRNLYNIVMSRIANPESKRGSVLDLVRNFGININLPAVYRMMDHIDDSAVDRIEELAYQNATGLLQEKISVTFFDCTTLYFESFTEDELMQKGYSKDNKFNQPQVLLALLATASGLPIGYEVYPGSTFEGHTLKDAIDKLRIKYELEQIIFTANSGLLSKMNLEYLESNGIKYIVGARLKNLPSKIIEQVTNINSFRKITGEENYEKINSLNLTENKKLIVTHSDSRAQKDKSDRTKAIDKLKIKLSKSRNPASLISNYGYKKFLKIEGTSKVSLRKDIIESAEKWDGIHGVITNVKDLSNRDIISQYHGLWQIEECFRISKHDLRVRPIYHWTPRRVRAHIAICFIALVCVRTLMYKMKILHHPMSPRAIKKELLSIQTSILKHNKKNIRYALPSNFSVEAEKIYKIMGKKLSRKPYIIES